MDVFILAEHCLDYDMIKHVIEDCVYTIYFDPQKYLVCNQYNGGCYSLLCKDFITSVINQSYQIVRNGFYVGNGLTTNRFLCSRCIQYKGDIKC